jgi:hypothetical protein
MARRRTPTVFISHREEDKSIALLIAQFIRDESGRGYSVFLSSHPKFKGVRAGAEISAELREAIADCDVFLLIYSRRDADWSWCMWEWGVACHPRSQKSTMMVLQCGCEEPKISTGSRLLDLRKQEAVFEFVKQYLTDKEVFRNGKAVAGQYEDDVLEAKATKLHADLFPLIKDIDPPKERSPWPYLQIAVPLETAREINTENAALDINAQIELVKKSATISIADKEGLKLFGRIGLTQNISLSKLARKVNAITRTEHTPLLDYCCRQIAEACADRTPHIVAMSVKDQEGVSEFVPVVTKVHEGGYLKTVLVDLYFVQLPSNTNSSQYKFLGKSQFHWKPLNRQFEEMKLLCVSENMRSQQKNRLPVLENFVVRYVIDRAGVDEFIVVNHAHAADLTILDLLADERMRSSFQHSFAFVDINCSAVQAKAKIGGIVQNVFMTLNGLPQEPILGWLREEEDIGEESRSLDNEREDPSASAPMTFDTALVAAIGN